MKHLFLKALLAVSLVAGLAGCHKQGRYHYETVEGDPMNVRAYTLDNGLRVYMTVNREQPRIQTYIAVRTGSKNDPAETTGLAHYLEHLMFKGTTSFGTRDYAAERPLLDTITALFEHYRTLTDPAERRAAYHVIDSISGIASQWAIPNEYDKMMALIGANGSNAFTSNDVTCYTEDIPSNQIENWARIESDRFKDPVFRLFHTELEAVYEEKNMSMTRDNSKEFEAIMQMLMPTHPYGTQTTIGSQEHLKNPSLVNIRDYFNKWYVPGNVCISLSGDFDPDAMVEVIERYFGDWHAQPGYVDRPEQLTFGAQPAITEPKGQTVMGQEAENVMMGWRIDAGAASVVQDTLNLVAGLLSNGSAGLIDIDLNQQQRVLSAGVFADALRDGTVLFAYGMPLPGQSLDEVRQLLLGEVERLARGDWDEQLIASVITDLKLSHQRQLERNRDRAMMMVDAFIVGEDWAHVVGSMDRMERIGKADIMDFVSRRLAPSAYVYVNKLQGDDPNIQRIDKPEIHPVESNRDVQSPFLAAIAAAEPEPIAPLYVDYAAAIGRSQTPGGLTLLHKANETNGLMTLRYVWEVGSDADKVLPLMDDLAAYVGTGQMSPDELQVAFYSLGCTFRLGCSDRRFYASIDGLDENLEPAAALMEQVLTDARVGDDVFASFMQMVKKARQDGKTSQSANFRQLVTYATYGPAYVKAHTLTDAELGRLTAADFIGRLSRLRSTEHRVVYYGPRPAGEVAEVIGRVHPVEGGLAKPEVVPVWPMLPTPADVVYVAPYTANNTYMTQVSNLDHAYDTALEPLAALYNEYFGGSMNAIVFQEMRETRGLAYSAWASFQSPSQPEGTYDMYTMIATQNDKLPEAVAHFNEIIDDMPESEAAFQNAKSALISRLRTERTTRASVLWSYLNTIEPFGLTADPRQTLFEGVQPLTLADIVQLQHEWVKGRHYAYCVLGDPRQIDMACLRARGEVKMLKTDEIFGY